MSGEQTGGDVVVQALKAVGVDMVFGIISIHNLPIYDAIARQGGIRLITNRSEPGAVNMADGYARATGKLGVAITSTGTGAGNAAGALVEAQTAGTPLLHLTGQIDSAYLDQGKMYIHEAKDQLGMLKAISKAAYRVQNSDSLAATLQTAIEEAFSGPSGVVSVEIPIDIQKNQAPSFEFKENIPKTIPELIDDSLHTIGAIEELQKAKRPLIWAGSGVIAAEAHLELTKLAELWGAAVLTSQAGRGAIPEDHPNCIGFYGLNPAVREFIQSCDVLLAVGTKLRGQETGNWKLALPKNIIQIDIDPAMLGRNYPTTHAIGIDAKFALQNLITHINNPQKPDPAFLAEIAEVRKACQENVRRTLGPYTQICDDINATISRDTIIVRDITIAGSTWASRLIPAYGPRQQIHASGGGIGQGLQMAIGAKLGQPNKPVIAICGDGGFMVNCGEMATTAQENVPLVVLLFNDGGYGVIRNIQDKSYPGRHFGVDLQAPDFMKLAEAFGWEGWRVKSTTEFRGAFEKALACGRPAMLEIDMTAIGPYAVPFGGPPSV